MARKKKTNKKDVKHDDSPLTSNETFNFSETDEYGKYPNELARISMSIKSGTFKNILITTECDDLLKSNDTNNDINETKSDESKNDSTSIITPGTEGIWKNLALRKINIFYAQVGTTLDGRPVLDHDQLMTLLTTYGFNIDDALHFVDDFAKNSENDKMSPIIMIHQNVSDIMDNVEPLENI